MKTNMTFEDVSLATKIWDFLLVPPKRFAITIPGDSFSQKFLVDAVCTRKLGRLQKK